jgi:predicted alpha-1,2-mannosidase
VNVKISVGIALLGCSILWGCGGGSGGSQSSFGAPTSIADPNGVAPQPQTDGIDIVPPPPPSESSLSGTGDPVFVEKDLARYVDGMIGTDQVPPSDTGSTEDLLGGFVNPVANLPFGMMTWGPRTPPVPKTWSPPGYHYPIKTINGFPLRNLSGVGCDSGGQFSFMPLVDSSKGSAGYDHPDQKSEPGYYRVKLDSQVDVELSATLRTGAGRFGYPAGSPAFLKITSLTDSAVVKNDDAISGTAGGGNFCNNRQYYKVYFYAKFDQPFTEPKSSSKSARLLQFLASAGAKTQVGVKVGMSYVSIDNAKANLAAENSDMAFDTVREQARAAWNKRLNTIQVEGGADADKVKFYTALYHALFAPQVFSDTNGDYPKMADAGGTANAGNDQVQYSTFSSWDSYRSLVPLQALIAPKEVGDQAQSLVNFAKTCGAGGALGTFPMWAEANTNSSIMPGDGASIIVAQSHAFGATGFDTAKAREIMLGTGREKLTTCRGVTTLPGLKNYIDKGFLADGYGHSSATSASTNMEYASTDFAVSRFTAALDAKTAPASSDASEFLQRSGNWANLFNPDWKNVPGQSQPQPQPRRADGTWFDYVFRANQDTHFREGNAEQYSYMVHHDMRGLFARLAKDAASGSQSEKDAIERLDAFVQYLNGGEQKPHLWIGNEPGFGVPYMYNWTSQPHKTQQLVRKILATLFTTKANGLPGNDDEGAMSGWYVWGALGLYPEVLAVPGLSLSHPVFDKAVVWRDGKPLLSISSDNAARTYIKGVKVNGQPYNSTWLNLELAGATKIEFESSDAPTCWASRPDADKLPPSFAPDGTQRPLLAPVDGRCP